MQTPSIWHASDGSRQGMIVQAPTALWTYRDPGRFCWDMYFHWLFLYSKSSKYQKQLSGTSTPPVAHKRPSQLLTEPCICFATKLAWLEGWVTHKLVLSTNANLTNDHDAKEIVPTIVAKNPSHFINSSNGKLMAAQMCSPAPFPCLIPAVGHPHFFLLPN